MAARLAIKRLGTCCFVAADVFIKNVKYILLNINLA